MVTAGILPFRENSHGRAGNRTLGLMISSQRLCPLEMGRKVLLFVFSLRQSTCVCLVGGEWLPVPSIVMELRFVCRPGKWLSALQEGRCCVFKVLHHSQASSYIESQCVFIGNESSEPPRVTSVDLSSQSLASLRVACGHSSVLSAVSYRPPVECVETSYYCRTARDTTCSRQWILFLLVVLRRHFHTTLQAVHTPNWFQAIGFMRR